MNGKIVVLGGNHVNTLGLVRSLGQAGLRCDVLLEDCDLLFCYLRFSKYIDACHKLCANEELVAHLTDLYGHGDEKSVLLCASDPLMSELDRHYDALKDRFVLFNAAGEQGRIDHFMSKAETFPLAADAGLETIKTWRVFSDEELPPDVIYPCIVKGNNSLSTHKEDMFVCADKETLGAHVIEGRETLIQEYVEKEYEIDVNGLSINHGKDVLIPGVVRKIREELDRQSDYIVLEDIPAGLDVFAIKRFVRAIGYEGLFSVEFMKKGDKFYFLEINLRNDGVNFLYTLGGINMPNLWVEYARGRRTDFRDVQVKLKTPIYLMQLFDLFNLKSGKVGLCTWLRDYCRAHGHFVFSLRDPAPFLYYCWIYVRQGFKRVRRQCHI